MRRPGLNVAAQVMTVVAGLLAMISKDAREFYVQQVRLPVWSLLLIAVGAWLGISWALSRERTVGAHDTAESRAILIGDTIRLLHRLTGFALHSHPALYSHPGTSRQQQVTAYRGADSNDYWVVKAQHGFGDTSRRGRVVSNGDIIRLEHRNTRKNLHSHRGTPSPVTGQQEVTAFGTDGVGDTNDNWRVDISQRGLWEEDVPMRLIHVLSECALHSHLGCAHPQYTSGQQEVTCFAQRDENDLWLAVRVETA